MDGAHLVGGTLRVVIEQDLQLVGASGVVKQSRCKVLALLPQALQQRYIFIKGSNF